jgi:hypothetical protein
MNYTDRMKERMKTLPDVLVASSGKQITSAEEWERTRRPEILELFKHHVYGRSPVGSPDSLHYEVVATPDVMEGQADRKQVTIAYEGPGGKGSFHLLIFIPKHAAKPCPVFLHLNNRGAELADPERIECSPFWPAELLVSRGYAAAVIQVAEIDPDLHDEFKNGVHGVFDEPNKPREKDAWGTIAAWAWGASRCMDYFETDPDIEHRLVAVGGHSRCGKAALWCGAEDTRFAMVISNNSGNTGAAISRNKQGEDIKYINTVFPHWFNENYKQYNENEHSLPVDQHMLLSLIAPRPLYVSSATEDVWADPESEFLSLICSEPVYRLYGLEGVGAHQLPAPETPLHNERMGYHLRTGKHDLTEYDWQFFIDFADRFLH